MAPRYNQKTIFNMASVRHLEFEKFRFLSNSRPRNGNLHRHTKFDRNRIILDWDMERMLFSKWRRSAILNRIILGWDVEIKLFSKWRPSAILNLRKMPFWSSDWYLHVILHLHSETCINWPIWRRDIDKKTIFNMASVRHPEFAKFRFFVKWPSWKL